MHKFRDISKESSYLGSVVLAMYIFGYMISDSLSSTDIFFVDNLNSVFENYLNYNLISESATKHLSENIK